MTASVKSLTHRVAKAAGPAVHPWSMPGSDVRSFVNGLGRLGYETRALLTAGALRDADLDDPDSRIPCEALDAILSCAQQQRFTPNLGLELARITPIGATPLLDYLVVTSDTVGMAVHQLARYLHLIGNPVALDVCDAGSGEIRVEMARGAAPFSLEYVSSLMILHLRAETEGRFAVAGMNFQHTPDDVTAFERILGCPVRSAAPWSGLVVSRDAWQLPLRKRDPVLHRVLEAHAHSMLARLPDRTGLAREVQRALTKQVAGGDTRIATLARQLAMSCRTLQRRLASEGVSYQQLLEDTRKHAASRYIAESTLGIGEIAYLVGYSEPAAFHRAFKRWFGVTPDVFRHHQRQRPPMRIVPQQA
jgi:AraC-like DNA-binding protein